MKRGVYLVPSLVTLANLAAGVLAIIFAAQDRFSAAAWAIVIAILFDMLDGRLARWAGATSQFGVELDSIADTVSFGVAPSFLIYQLALQPMGRPGYAIAVFFVMAAALRLARFNLSAREGDEPSTHFIGLPVPAAAGILASFVLSYELFGETELNVKTIPLLMRRMPIFFRTVPVVMVVLSFLMISRVHYGSFKKLHLGRPKSLQTLVVIAAAVILVITYPQNTIFILFLTYVLSGLLMLAWRFYRAGQWRPRLLMNRRRSDMRPADDSEPKTASTGFPWNQEK